MAYGNYAPFYRTGFFNPMQAPTMPVVAENQNQFAQPYQAPIQTPPMQPNAPINDMIFVLGQNEAESYPVAPNATVTMWDKNQKTFYIKTANAQGVPSMQIYDFTERVENAPKSPVEHICGCEGKYPKIEQFNDLSDKFENILGRVEELEERYKAIPVKATPKSTKKTEE